jgi:hypothetical protein
MRPKSLEGASSGGDVDSDAIALLQQMGFLVVKVLCYKPEALLYGDGVCFL